MVVNDRFSDLSHNISQTAEGGVLQKVRVGSMSTTFQAEPRRPIRRTVTRARRRLLLTPVSVLDFSTRSRKCMARLSISAAPASPPGVLTASAAGCG